MAGVGEAGAHDAAVAGGDRLAVVACDEIRDDDEFVGKSAIGSDGRRRLVPGHDRRNGASACGVAHHEAFLVGADGGADHLRRDFEERRLEFAHQHDRPFDEAGDFLEQPFVLDEFEPMGQRETARIGQDDVLAPPGVEHDPSFRQRIGIIVKAPDLDRAGRHEAMAERHIA